jgi:hypothetical protein
MNRQSVFGPALAALFTVGLAMPVGAQTPRFTCEIDYDQGSTRRHCEIREYTIGASGTALGIDARPNGSIEVIGSPRADVLVRARVVANARTDATAQQIASAVQVRAVPGQVSADGPRDLEDRQGWSVSYQVLVPMQTWLSLRSTNGALRISDVDGEIDFQTTNGAVTLANLSGQVKGRTTNGAVNVVLDGPSWTGPGLDVETTNGAVKLSVPDGYSARLQASTVNGRTRVDFPVTMQGRLDRGLDVTLGSGGPTIKVTTRNGGVQVSSRQ